MKLFMVSLVLGLAAVGGTYVAYQEPDDHSLCATSCSPSTTDFKDKNGHTNKACKCEAQNNKGCDKDGNRSAEGMANCVNGEHCKKNCCHCCPRD
jgi:hypothetical protein